MNRIAHRTFDGVIPRLEPTLLPENAAQTANDVDLRRGVLTPLRDREDSPIAGAACGTGKRTIYLWRYTDCTLTLGVAGNTSAAAWAALAATAGFSFTLDGVSVNVNPSFTGDTTMAQVAASIQEAIRAVTEGMEIVQWATDRFVISTNRPASAVTSHPTKANLSTASWLNGPGTAASTSGEEWLSWDGTVHVVRGPVNDDPYSRIYFTGDGVPRMTLRIGGQTVTRALAIEKPASAPTVNGTAYEEEAVPGGDIRENFTVEAVQLRTYSGNTGALLSTKSVAYTRNGDFLGIAEQDFALRLPPSAAFVNIGYYNYRFRLGVVINGQWLDSDADVVLAGPANEYECRIDRSAATVHAGPIRTPEYNYPSGDDVYGWSTAVARVTVTVSGRLGLKYAEAGVGDDQLGDTPAYVTYCVSFVTDLGEESELGPASAIVAVDGTQDVALTAVPQPADVQRGILYTRLYRAAGGVFRWLADIPFGTTTYTDTTADDDTGLGEEPPAVGTPPNNLQGIVACAGGWFAAFHGREVCVTEPYMPYAWPESSRLTVQDEVVALAAAGSDLFVMTQGRPVMLSGSVPAELTAIQIESDQACVSAAGVATLGNLVLYPSPDGLVGMYAGAARLLTADFFRREDWQLLGPTTIRASGHDNRYYAALGTAGADGLLIVDFGETADRMTRSSVVAEALFADVLSDTLYLNEDGVIRAWNAAATPMQLDWRGREWRYPRPVSFGAIRVRAAGYPVPAEDENGVPLEDDRRPLLTLYANGVQVLQQRITSDRARRLPFLRPEKEWSVRVQSMVEVSEILVATGIRALLG